MQEEPKKDAGVEGSDGQIPDDSKDVEILIETKESSSNSAYLVKAGNEPYNPLEKVNDAKFQLLTDIINGPDV